MTSIRRCLKDRSITGLLLLALALRSLIAPGFMLDTASESPLGISITVCGGLNGIDAIEGMAPLNGNAGHHHHHMPMDDEVNFDNSGMSATPCGALSASLSYVNFPVLAVFQVVLLQAQSLAPVTISPFTRDAYHRQQQPRAPPFSRFA